MVTVVNSKNFDVPRIYPPSSKSTSIQLSGFPTFYSKDNEYLLPVNLWFNYLVNIRKAVDITASVRALKRYWQFLETNNYSWDNFPANDYLKPTYRFRNDDLLKAARSGEIAFSTASMYILHVIKFYEWAAHERFITFTEENKPFNYQIVHIANSGIMNHNNPRFAVRSTDLRIRKPARNEQQKLNPLSQQELFCFADCLRECSEEFIIHQLLQIQSGLRVEEACTFPFEVVEMPQQHIRRYEVEIGANNGVHTKFNKTRKVEIPNQLMRKMYDYLVSDRRLKRASKTDNTHKTLLLNNLGNPLCSNNVQQHFRRLKHQIQQKHNIVFSHRTHDLRATYGTYRLDSLMNHLPVGDALALIMGWMGHKDDKTTWKYLRYLRKEKANQNAIVMLDQILEEAML
ncbi:site-specific integrase [Vibrio sp. 11986-1-5]|uniref:site-specific integrase n=1 Tax=Vibrio sp. 11986-1-5 TaxID=2211215 RepID=UPI0015E83425|nr:site-specific integrase [Vibrio sp. 11986-1-5]